MMEIIENAPSIRLFEPAECYEFTAVCLSVCPFFLIFLHRVGGEYRFINDPVVFFWKFFFFRNFPKTTLKWGFIKWAFF